MSAPKSPQSDSAQHTALCNAALANARKSLRQTEVAALVDQELLQIQCENAAGPLGGNCHRRAVL